MPNLLRALHRRYLTRGLTREERARLAALPSTHWPTPEEFSSDVEKLAARFAAQLDRKVRARAQNAPNPDAVGCPTCEASDGVPCRPLYLDLADLRGPFHPARVAAAAEKNTPASSPTEGSV
jgi:hypothetical protein